MNNTIKDRPVFTRPVVVLDTSVALFDANSIYGFSGYDIVIPLVVLDEIDKFRSLDSEVGRNARSFVRLLKAISSENKSLSGGIQRLASGELVIVRFLEHTEWFTDSINIDLHRNDDVVLANCLEMIRDGVGVGLATKDISLSVKANVLGIPTIEYVGDGSVKDVSELYTGVVSVTTSNSIVDKFYSENSISVEECFSVSAPLFENSGVVITSGSSKSALGIYRNNRIERIVRAGKSISSVVPKNKEQEIAAELLLNPDVKLLTLTGPAGTGKTLLAIASGIQMAVDGDSYDRVIVSRPVHPLGKDLGYLPGDIYDKMAPWIGPIKDAVEVVLGDTKRFDDLMRFGKIDIEPLTYIRGRSIPRTFFVLDESQNITQHEMKAIISRMGHGSKIVLTGDIFQIDNYYLDTVTNGLTVVVEKFKSSSLAGHVTLTKGQRSELATMAAEIL